MNLANLKIRTRPTLGFAALAALMGLLGAVSMHHLLAIHDQFDTVMNDRYPKLQTAGEIRAVNNEVAQALRNLFVVSDPDDIKAQYDLIAGSSKRTNANIEKLTQTIARGVAAGNLAMEFEARGTSETSLLPGALHAMKTRLARLVGDVRGNVEGGLGADLARQ